MTRCNHLSASSISAFKACPTRYRLAYVEGLRKADDTDSQRRGTNWHKMHEVYAASIGVGDGEDLADQAVISLLNEAYKDIPATKTAEEWELERTILHVSFIGYKWFWQNDPITVLASEVPFNLPLHMPRTGLPLPMSEVQRVGKIDHIVKWQSAVCALERKSTSRSIAADSDYWDRSKKDSQVSMYALAFRDLIATTGDISTLPWSSAYLPVIEQGRFGNTLYDVWHVPTIKPTYLTQKASEEFVVSHEYMGQKFTVGNTPIKQPDETFMVEVDGVKTLVEIGKKGWAIRETVGMYAARLLNDIYTRPDFYFARREIARTDAELRGFRKQLFGIYQAQKSYAELGSWFENEGACRATFACPFIGICYGPGSDAVSDGVTTPPGYKRIFVDLTVNKQALPDEE